MLYITEKAILKLTNCVDAAEFDQLYTESRLRIPFFSSIKSFAGLASQVLYSLAALTSCGSSTTTTISIATS